jgi:hypothetical protein
MRRAGLPGCDTYDGKCALPQLPPGRYRLVFHPTIAGSINLQHTFYWPSPKNVSNSGVIELGFGQHVDNVLFEISVMDNAH